mmetsp:Transcript_22397/g.44372  ORF Transcript_22397/g.44372 Transcript_22397/m.44372 type:complete len:241 (+) Transcript_22397:423-1145(+)
MHRKNPHTHAHAHTQSPECSFSSFSATVSNPPPNDSLSRIEIRESRSRLYSLVVSPPDTRSRSARFNGERKHKTHQRPNVSFLSTLDVLQERHRTPSRRNRQPPTPVRQSVPVHPFNLCSLSRRSSCPTPSPGLSSALGGPGGGEGGSTKPPDPFPLPEGEGFCGSAPPEGPKGGGAWAPAEAAAKGGGACPLVPSAVGGAEAGFTISDRGGSCAEEVGGGCIGCTEGKACCCCWGTYPG